MCCFECEGIVAVGSAAADVVVVITLNVPVCLFVWFILSLCMHVFGCTCIKVDKFCICKDRAGLVIEAVSGELHGTASSSDPRGPDVQSMDLDMTLLL